ncbi:hypothetical protein J4E89_004709 [Alternaria sp. Ai002NY15]|nr:hypothetical protein J4E89_004709 [Alternaria sp. Ai002NY15]
MSQSKTAILRLPDELLVSITGGVEIVDLHALSLTCRLCFFESMTVLFTLAHSLKATSFNGMSGTIFDEVNDAYHAFVRHNKPATISTHQPIRQARSDLQARLEEINVEVSLVREYLHNSLIMGLDPVDFSRLKRLVIPYQYLFDKLCIHDRVTFGDRIRDPATAELRHVLPSSLESLRTSISHENLWPGTQWLDNLIADDVNFPRLREVQLLYPYNIVSMGWHYRSIPYSNNKEIPAALQRWRASRVGLTTAFGTTKFSEIRWEEPSGNLTTETRKLYADARQPERHYTTGDLIPVIEKCLATTHDQLEKEPEMMAALGYVLRSP